MAEFLWKSAVVAVIVLGLNDNQINLVRAGKCDLEKTFRTPRDMSKVNFDHFEIVERDGYDIEPTTTTTEAPLESKKNGDTIAKAQVHLRFGGDDIYGSNHIMKIPPQCRNMASQIAPHYPSPYYPPHYAPYYYHPYPPPVPYRFPYYYFCNSAQESQNLPRPLQEYFRTHGQLGEGDFTRGYPAMEDGSHHTDFMDVNRRSKNLLKTNIADDTRLQNVATALFIKPRTLEPLNQIDEDIEEIITANTKTDACAAEKDGGNKKNATTKEPNHIIDFSDKLKKHHKHHEKKYKKDELKDWLRKALVAYEKCPNCTESSETLEKLDSCETDETECKCLQCQCSKKDEKLNNDMDELDIVVAEIIDPYDKLSKTSKKDQKSLVYNLAKIGVQLADSDSIGFQQVPPKISLDLELFNNEDARTASFIDSSSTDSYRYPKSKNSHCGCRHTTSNPCAAINYQAPTNIETLYADEADIGCNRYPIPRSYYGSRNPCGFSNSYSSPSVYHNHHSHATASPSNCYFYPEPNVYIKKEPEPYLPKLAQLLPGSNLKISSNNAPRFCAHCGHEHSGNNFCDNCGNPLAIHSTCRGY
ncbi:unnamed protein product [Ceutorhynchus assimilis]|uniref:Uncharacterized protein n=1 Tax=Ceutorhynchus assimilis TaxID=467358 RepID=A0A9N9MSZ2_9CUCU|nr:unnamed protein product [Ceutorhynchus assimilis]